jgi:hypothetical protein
MPGQCRNCRHFSNDPALIEDLIPGLASLGSAHGSTRADDGFCRHHDLYLGAAATCADFAILGPRE